MKRILLSLLSLVPPITLWAQPWNLPHIPSPYRSVYHSSITGIPKTLDPARAYNDNESAIISQIYEPPYQYHYLKRPYHLAPLTALTLPKITFYDKQGHLVNSQSNAIAKTVYDIKIRPGIYYQPHPAFAKNQQGLPRYLALSAQQLKGIYSINDFPKTGTKELTASDYIYEIKRLASPRVSSPIFGVMREHILGFDEFSTQLENYLRDHPKTTFLDLTKFPLQGVKKINRYHYQIILKGKYLQFKYWLAMNFFAPIPRIVDEFYSQPSLKARNISLSSYPVGTGPYMLSENNPNKRIVLSNNPNFHEEFYPIEGDKYDKEKGWLKKIGMRLPFIDKLIFTIEKESIPRWNKFLQGYYDKSGIGESSFDQAIQLNKYGKPVLTPELEKKGIHLQTSTSPATYYLGFNMLDPIVGGYSEAKRKLRQAIAIALNSEEYIAIFLNGRGIAAQSPIPPAIFGHLNGKKGYNPYLYHWINGKLVRKSLAYAKKLLVEAGYPNGRDPKTGKALILHYDVTTSGSPGDNSLFNWYRQQFAKLGIQLDVRATLYNRFQTKVRSGKAQLFSWGWIADYPDPENFLFLLYGPNGKVKYGGENVTNYLNTQADKLFNTIRDMVDSPERQQKIQQWLQIVRQDSPMVWQFHPINFVLSHQWVSATKPGSLIHNGVKYMSLDHRKRNALIHLWNQPAFWIIALLITTVILLSLLLGLAYWRREHKIATPKVKE